MAKLLVQESFNVEVLHENTASGKALYIEGIFAQSNIKNRNGRVYPKEVMEQSVDAYITNYVSQRRALGELNHPDRPFADPNEAAILIESLTWDGDNVIGKARVMDTHKGKNVAALLEAGFNMGVSTRGLGSINEVNGTKYVQNDFLMTAVDCVDQPSAPNAYVSSLYESTWVNKNGVWLPATEERINEETEKFNDELFLERFEQFVKSLRRS
jgi:hypothetical protein